MVRVKLWGSLRSFVDGAERVEVEVRDFRQLLDGLRAEYLALIQQIDSSVSMALDWVIYRDAWFFADFVRQRSGADALHGERMMIGVPGKSQELLSTKARI